MASTNGHTSVVAPLLLTCCYKENWFMNGSYQFMNPKKSYRLMADAEQERQNLERVKMRLEKAKSALPDFDLNLIYPLTLRRCLRDKMKLGCSLAYIYAYYSQDPNSDELLSYSLKDFQGRLFENEFYLFPDKSSCHISDILTITDHQQIAKNRRAKQLKKVAGFTKSFLKKVIAHAL